jgi:glycosyltransferase involved in cell wall biosynthesis
MKISLITACYNSAGTIRTAIESVLAQKGVDVEYIVVDGGSKDGTVDIIRHFEQTINSPNSSTPTLLHSPTPNLAFKWISERDRGMYDAINKGIKMATGDVVGILNADDVLADDETLKKIAEVFSHKEQERQEKAKGVVDCVYADIRFVTRQDAASPCRGSLSCLRNAETVRYCSAKSWRPWMFRFAAMVPHPSFYVRRECFERLGGYSLDYRICADFELELRYLYLAKLRAVYLPECVVVMRMGGMSTAGWRSNIVINREDLRALRAHGIWSCLPLIYLKYLFKVWGFVFKRK